MKYVYGRVIVSGDVIEVYRYERGYVRQVKKSVGRAGNGETLEYEKRKNRETSLQRARGEIRRIINANFNRWGVVSKFVTLTFSDNIQDLSKANTMFRNFIKRLNYHVFNTKQSVVKYTAVVEFQKRGAVHYHVVFYNLPYISNSLLRKIWGHGYVKINAVDNVDNVGAYVSKYLTKSNDDERLKGHKCYFNSKGLRKPNERVLNVREVEKILGSLPSEALVYESDYSNDYIGDVKYYQFNLKRKGVNYNVG